jgi:hypothetical protein
MKLSGSVLVIITCIAAACSNDVDQPLAPVPGSAALAKAPPPPPAPVTTFRLPLDGTGLAVTSDGLFGDGTFSAYTEGVCGVTATIFTTGSGDAVMQTNKPGSRDRQCASTARTWRLAYDDGFVETIPVFVNLHQIENSSFTITVGTTVKRKFGINPTQNTRCDRLVWGENSDSVLVTRTATNRWEIESQPAPNDRAWCSTTGASHHMPIRFVVSTQ